MRTARWRGMALPILCLIISACAKHDARTTDKNDPNTPAIVELGMPKPPPAEKQPPQPIVNETRVAVRLAENYSVLAAAMTFGDARMIGTLYAKDAELTMPSGTWNGVTNIAASLGALGREKSLKDFRRSSMHHRLVDSTVVDSGTYVITTKRPGADSIFERGSYAAQWRIMPDGRWVMERDQLQRHAAERPKKL